MRKPPHKIIEKDIQYISKHINKLPVRDIAKNLGISISVVYKIINNLNLKFVKYDSLEYYLNKYDKWIFDYIIEYYPNTSAYEISKTIPLTPDAIGRIAKKLGLVHSKEFLNRRNIVGQKFGYLFVLEQGKITGRKGITCTCQCDCGNICYVRSTLLIEGRKKSCGCLARETKHGDTNKPLYWVHSAMKDRCYNPRNKNYFRYGGRGIKVCPEWMSSYESFRNWAYNNGYKEGLTIDRINNDGDYCPENCRWVSMSEQSLNRRSNRKITYLGKTQTLAEWARELNIKYSTLYSRVINGTFPPKDNHQTTNDNGTIS